MPPLFTMSDMNPKGKKLKLGNMEYELRFTINAIDEIQDHFDVPIDELGTLLRDPKNQIKNIRWLLTLLVNEGIDCKNDELSTNAKDHLIHLDERYVGRHLDVTNISELQTAILRSVVNGVPESTEEDDDPNVKGE